MRALVEAVVFDGRAPSQRLEFDHKRRGTMCKFTLNFPRRALILAVSSDLKP